MSLSFHPFADFSDYSFRHWVRIQAEQAPTRVHRIFVLLDDNGANAWFAVRHTRGELDGWIADLERAWLIAEEISLAGEPAHGIGLQLRYALMRAILPELLTNLTPSVVGRMISSGLMATSQALTWGRQGKKGGDGFQVLVEALRQAGPAALAEEWLEAIDVGGTILDSDNRLLSIAAHATLIPFHLQQRMLAVIAAEPNEGSSSGALRTLMESSDLSKETKRQAWRIACNLRQDAMRSQTMLVVASTLGVKEQREAIASCRHHLATLDEDAELDYDNALRVGNWHDRERECLGLASLKPKLLDEARDDCGLPVFQGLLAAARFVQRSRLAPIALFDGLVSQDEPLLLPEVWQRLCVALGGASRWGDALACLDRIDNPFIEAWQQTIAYLLAHAPDGHRTSILERFAALNFSQQNRVFTLARGLPGARPDALRQLADYAASERDGALMLADLSDLLADSEIEVVFGEFVDDLEVLAKLALRLSLVQVQKALSVHQHSSIIKQSERAILLSRLGTLTDYSFVLEYIQGTNTPSDRKEMIDVLIRSCPDSEVAALFSMLLPDNVLHEATLLRGRMIVQSSSLRLAAMLYSITHLPTVRERLETVSELIEGGLTEPGLSAVSNFLVGELRAALADFQPFEQWHGVESAVAALSHLTPDVFSEAFADTIVSAIRVSEASGKDKIDWLSQLCTVDGTAPGAGAVWRTTFQLIVDHQDYEAFQTVLEAARPDHQRYIAELVNTLPDGGFVIMLAQAGSKLGAAADPLCDRIACDPHHWNRFQGYASLLEQASVTKRREIAARERGEGERLAALHERYVWRFLCSSLDPELESQADLESQFSMLEEGEQVLAAAAVFMLPVPPPRWLVAAAAPHLAYAEGDGVEDAIIQVAPYLSFDEVDLIIRERQWRGFASIDALAALARAGLRMDSAHFLKDCVAALGDRLFEDSLLTAVLDDLPTPYIASRFAYGQGSPSVRDPLFYLSSNFLTALARRMAEAGEVEAMAALLERNGPNSGSGDVPIEEIFDAVPGNAIGALIEIAERLDPYRRIAGLAALLRRAPEFATADLLDDLVHSSIDRGCQNKIVEGLAPALSELSEVDLLALVKRMLRVAAPNGRNSVLRTMQIFAAHLLKRYGQPVADTIDDACVVGCRTTWL